MKITRALISVSNKEGLEELARRLVDQGIELISTCLLYTSDAADE